MKKTKPTIETPNIQQEEVIKTPIKITEPATFSLHNIKFTLLKLDDFLLDPRLGHLDWTAPNPSDPKLPNDLSKNPFGQLISVFVYKPYLEMNGGTYDSNHGFAIGDVASLDMRPRFGRLERRVMGDAVVKLAPIPNLISQYNPITGKTETIFKFTAKDITITNEFSNVVNKVSSQVYTESATQKIQNGLSKYQEEFLAPKLSNNEANAIVTGRYNSNEDPSNMTACSATKIAIRNSSEYINGNIQEYIYMTLGEEKVIYELTKEQETISEKNNITLVAVNHISDFPLAYSKDDEAREHNKGYLVIDPEVIQMRKARLSQVNQTNIVNSAQSEYGASDETIRRALAAYNKK